jgi:hypothetical protein
MNIITVHFLLSLPSELAERYSVLTTHCWDLAVKITVSVAVFSISFLPTLIVRHKLRAQMEREDK